LLDNYTTTRADIVDFISSNNTIYTINVNNINNSKYTNAIQADYGGGDLNYYMILSKSVINVSDVSNYDNRTTGFSALTNIKEISCGSNHTLGLSHDGIIYGSGSSAAGSTTTITSVTAVTSNASTFVQISAGGYHSLGLTNNGLIYGAGVGDGYRLGNSGVLEFTRKPFYLLNSNSGIGTKPVSIVTSGYTSAYLSSDGSIYTTGNGVYGFSQQTTLGYDNIAIYTPPFRWDTYGELDNYTFMYLKSDGSLYVYKNRTNVFNAINYKTAPDPSTTTSIAINVVDVRPYRYSSYYLTKDDCLFVISS
jgi:hypothetical protein